MTDEAAVLVEPTACAVHAARAIRAGAAGRRRHGGHHRRRHRSALTVLAALRHLDDGATSHA